jgi:hypothetical protein
VAIIDTRPFAHDPVTGAVSQWYHYDEASDEIILEDVVDLETIGEFNREQAKVNTGRFKDGFHWIGSIPMPIYWKLKQAHVFDDPKLLRRWWLSDEAAPFRGRDMRL